MNDRYPCPCCGYLTLGEEPPGTFAVCPVCAWEDDNVQYHDHEYEGGANAVSLSQAKAIFSVLERVPKAMCHERDRPVTTKLIGRDDIHADHSFRRLQ